MIGKLHPLLVHFPIALVLAAAGAELTAIVMRHAAWRAVAIANIRAGAALGIATAVAGWVLASSPVVDATPVLEWHRWVGIASVIAAVVAALGSAGDPARSRGARWAYRGALFSAAMLAAITGHLGGTLVWGGGWLKLR
jgi:uncharacterized membrane protein